MIDTFLVTLNSLLVITVLLLLLKKQNAFESKEDLYIIFSLLNKIQMNQEELANELAALKEQTARATLEILAKIAALEEAIANAGNTTPEVDAALADLKAAVQGVDDVA